MTKAEAKRYVLHCVAMLIDPAAGHENGFLYQPQGDDNSDSFSDADIERATKALADLTAELFRRAKPRQASRR